MINYFVLNIFLKELFVYSDIDFFMYFFLVKNNCIVYKFESIIYF